MVTSPDLENEKNQSINLIKKPLLTSTPDLNPKFASEMTVQHALCTLQNTKCLLSPLEINTQNINTSKELLSSYQTVAEISPQKDEILNVVVIDVEHPWSFHVQFSNSLNVEISQKIREYICSEKMYTLVADQGLYCLARFEDGCFYRAKVKSVQGEMVSVKYVDYGNSQIVPSRSLCTTPKFGFISSKRYLVCFGRNLKIEKLQTCVEQAQNSY
ncbi:ATP-dependent RNA helicase tdrd9 [Bulinus truncatus]|nr:ATP-dependent RNA helicase tdrd9 [Bulinus truncatus]